PEVLSTWLEPLDRIERARCRKLRLPAGGRAPGALREGGGEARAGNGPDRRARNLYSRALDLGSEVVAHRRAHRRHRPRDAPGDGVPLLRRPARDRRRREGDRGGPPKGCAKGRLSRGRPVFPAWQPVEEWMRASQRRLTPFFHGLLAPSPPQ